MGVYDWKQPELFSKNFKRFMHQSSFENGIIMTHPGLPDEKLRQRDTYNEGRIKEFEFLKKINFNETFELDNVFPAKFNFDNSVA